MIDMILAAAGRMGEWSTVWLALLAGGAALTLIGVAGLLLTVMLDRHH